MPRRSGQAKRRFLPCIFWQKLFFLPGNKLLDSRVLPDSCPENYRRLTESTIAFTSFTRQMTTPAELTQHQTGSPHHGEPLIRYSRTAMILHWLIAAGILCNVALGLSVDFLPDDWIRPVIDTHKSIGITVLGLVLLRILWRVAHRPPPLPKAFPAWERASAHAAHLLLYVLMIGLPLSGWLHDSAWKDAATHR